MKLRRTTGSLYAFGASLALASSFVFSKSALNQLTMVQFGLLWFSLGVLWNAIWFISRREYRNLTGETRQKWLVSLLIAVLEGTATGLFYMAIKAMENPAVVSFIGNIGPVFVTLMGLILLRERFSGSQIAGIVITIAGVFIINYKQGGFAGFMDPGARYVIAASFLFSLATIAGRKYKQWLLPGAMSLIRSLLLAAGMGLLFLLDPQEISLNIAVIRDLSIGSFLETLLVIVFAYQALKMIEATRTSLIISSKGVWTLLLAWIFLGVFPTNLQLIGGLLTLIGVWLITWNRSLSR